jgi:hypothetical protein
MRLRKCLKHKEGRGVVVICSIVRFSLTEILGETMMVRALSQQGQSLSQTYLSAINPARVGQLGQRKFMQAQHHQWHNAPRVATAAYPPQGFRLELIGIRANGYGNNRKLRMCDKRRIRNDHGSTCCRV